MFNSATKLQIQYTIPVVAVILVAAARMEARAVILMVVIEYVFSTF